MNMDLLVKEIARVVLAHGYLHLGHCTLFEFIGQELDVSDKTLVEAEQYLDNLLKEQS
jgi:hypothetical protein